MERSFDCLIVGAGVIGLSHALAAARHGLRTAVVDRDASAAGASVRNFGFITVTGQPAGLTWRRARRARDVWAEVAPLAGITVLQRGLLVCARRHEALHCLEEFAAGPMGEDCRLLRGGSLAYPLSSDLTGALHSPHELRVDSREAIPRLTTWLEQERRVAFHPRVAVRAVEPGRVETSAGLFTAEMIVVCPGPDLVTLFPEELARREITLCKLHMLRIASPGWSLPAPVMSDLALLHYDGYADCASLPALRARLAAEQEQWLAAGIQLVVVQNGDGSLVVGESRHYGSAPDPYQPREVDDLILSELSAVLDIERPHVVERWTGVFPSGPDIAFVEAPMQGVRLAMVTSGTGASTGFAIGEETIADLLGLAAPPYALDPGA